VTWLREKEVFSVRGEKEMFNVLNPGPNAAPPYQQPHTEKPAANPQVANHPVGANPLQIHLENVRRYSQPGTEGWPKKA
jgi:hypothetical protein